LTDLLLARLAYAESPVFAPSIVAIGGYDPVTYFSQAKPVSRTVSGPDIAPRTTAQAYDVQGRSRHTCPI